jgi:formylglycine-generating enzyme required for sulfatase activity
LGFEIQESINPVREIGLLCAGFFMFKKGRKENVMKKLVLSCVLVLAMSGMVLADTFGIGANQFTIDFVNISGDSGDLGSWSAGSGYTFSGVNHNDYRMGTYEITNDQWNKFKDELGVPVTGNPSDAYDDSAYWTGTNVPTNEVSWYEAAQFVNWLNTSTSHHAAYKFTGTQGQSEYIFVPWDIGDAGYDASNAYRNSNAFYFLPTEDEWVKAGYWNGTMLQTYATKAGDTLFQGNGTNGGWNYCDPVNGPYVPEGPWNVGSGSEELNGTFDIMGNVWEWMESPLHSEDYLYDSLRVFRGGSYCGTGNDLSSSFRIGGTAPDSVGADIGFRVASVPEPCTVFLLGLGGLGIMRIRRMSK